MDKNKNLIIATGALAVVSILASGVTLAATVAPAATARGGTQVAYPRPAAVPGVLGTVSAVNGTTLTVQPMGWGLGMNVRAGEGDGNGRPSSTTPAASVAYTVDAANATVMKNGTTSSVAAIAVGDRILVRGTVSGTNVTATSIVDGVGPIDMGERMGNATSMKARAGVLASLQGNGEPVVGGTVTAVNGAMFTVTNEGSSTYSIDATNAKVVKGNATSSYSAIAVNDRVVVQGVVNGTSVAASSIIDQGPSKVSESPSSTESSSAPRGVMGGFAHGIGSVMGGIGSFFHRVFGFF